MKDYVVYVRERIQGEATDDVALNDALQTIKENGCGELRWARTLYIKNPIYINYKEYSALLLHGFGEVSKIKVDDNADYMESVLTIDYSGDEYGARAVNIEQVYIDCNNRADHGLVLGGTHPVVQSRFTLLNIVNAMHYGLVLDATQNCHFDLVNVEHCYGALRLINGAGNNVFTKCEFNEDIYNKDQERDTPLISFEQDPTRYSFGRNGFGNTPQMNIFINPVIERYNGKREINLEYGNHNIFIDAEIQYDKIYDGGECIYISEGSSYNKISMRLNVSQNPFNGIENKEIPVNNLGFGNTFHDSFVQNCISPAVIKSNKVTYCRNVYTNNNIDVLQTYGVDDGHAYNVDRVARYFYDNNDINDLKIGQIGFRDSNTPGVENDLLIKMKDGQIFRIMTEKYDDKYAKKYKAEVEKFNTLQETLLKTQKELNDLKNQKSEENKPEEASSETTN